MGSSATTFTAANGQTATLNGTWAKGTAVNNATGIETGTNYLGFSSVTIQVRNGTPITRYGLLQDDLGGDYARDTYNRAGTKVVQRQILTSTSSTSPVAQTWTGSQKNRLTVLWNSPDSRTNNSRFVYQWNVPIGFTNYNLMRANAVFDKPISIDFDGSYVMTRTYAWWVILSRHDNWNYRQQAATGAPYNARSHPSYDAISTEPEVDSYWNFA